MLIFVFYIVNAFAQATPENLDDWMDSVVLIITGSSWCSGVVIDDAGTVATAYHCVVTGQKSQVWLRDGQIFTGKVFAGDLEHDLALIAVPELAGLQKPLSIKKTPPQFERYWG